MSTTSESLTGGQARRHEVTERIKHYILENKLQPGDPLPTEAELCDALGASRTSIREAVKTLNALDIVNVRHGHGTYVGRLSLSALVEGLTFRGLLSPADDFQTLADLVDMRELMERGMAERIIDSIDATQLEALDALVDEMQACARAGESFAEADRSFHAMLVEPLGNNLVRQLSSAFWDVYAIVAPHLKLITPEDERTTIDVHRRMVEAARDEDVEGFVRAVDDHYAPVRKRIALAHESPEGEPR